METLTYRGLHFVCDVNYLLIVSLAIGRLHRRRRGSTFTVDAARVLQARPEKRCDKKEGERIFRIVFGESFN